MLMLASSCLVLILCTTGLPASTNVVWAYRCISHCTKSRTCAEKEQGSVQTRYVVLDEADMMLSMGFSDDVETILESVPKERQTMLFSATMPSWVKNITRRHLNNPALVDLVGDSQSGKMPDSIRCTCALLSFLWPCMLTMSSKWTSDLLAGCLFAIESTLLPQSKHVWHSDCNVAELSEGEPRMTVMLNVSMMIHIGHDDP